MSSKNCKLCNSTSFEPSNDGSIVCTTCGTIRESANIVSEVQFGDNSSIVGTFVSATRRTTSNYRSLGGRDSRAMSLENARRRLDEIGTFLKIRAHHIDSAQRSFELAMENNFTKGRKTKLVAASCLYIVCRREKTPHLLIDFSEVLQVNVFTLASTFIQLIKLLNIQLPIVDPSFFIYRFSSALEFGSQTKEVSATANKLVARMKRDWMSIGRKPSGICGAALYIAAKIHGFKRSMKEIVHTVKIGEATLLARLEEFRRTPSASLKFSEFEEMDIEDECDPPSFTRNRLKEKLQLEKELEDQKKKDKVEKKKLKKLKKERKLKKDKKSKNSKLKLEQNEEIKKENQEEESEKENEEEKEDNDQDENLLDSDLDEYDDSVTINNKRKKKSSSSKNKKLQKTEEELEKESLEIVSKQTNIDIDNIVSGTKTLDSIPSTLLENIDKFEEIQNDKKKELLDAINSINSVNLPPQSQTQLSVNGDSLASQSTSTLQPTQLLTSTTIDRLSNQTLSQLSSTQTLSQLSQIIDEPIPENKTLSSQVSYPPLPLEVNPSVFEPNDTLEDLSDEELDFYLEHDKEMVRKKEMIWTELNKEWIEKNAERQKEIEEDIKAGRPPRKRKQVSKKSAENAQLAAEEELKRKTRNAKLVEKLGLFKPNFYGDVLGGVTSSTTASSTNQNKQSQQQQQQQQKQQSEEYEEPKEPQGSSLLSQTYDNSNYGYADDYDDY